ncbi:MAG: hypothetical protein HY680_07465 [Chloroflexi bacterium]|nr:hypothetical protein [Chloroflexota bacterium]
MSTETNSRQETRVTTVADRVVQYFNVSELGGGRRASRVDGRKVLLLPLLVLFGSLCVGLAVWRPVVLPRDTVLVLLGLGSGLNLAAVLQSVVTARPKALPDTGFFVFIVLTLAFALLANYSSDAVQPLRVVTVVTLAWSFLSMMFWLFPEDR